jgi:microcystin degradation protein MlrC
MLRGADHGRTTQPGIMRDLLARAEAFEKQPGLNVVSIQVGFTWSDIPWAGPSIAVSHEPGAEDAAQQAAEALIAEMWARRNEFSSSYRSIEEAVAAVRRGGDRPLVLAEGTYNPGGGGYNDAPNLLRALLEAGVPNVAVGTIYDPGTVRQALKAGVGARIEVALGGHTDPSLGAPVRATAEVRHLSDGNFRNDGPMNAGVQVALGATAVLRLGDSIDVVATSTRMHTIDLQVFLSQGIDPLGRNVLVVKSSQHFCAAFEPIAREVMLVDAGGLCSTDASRFTYAKLRRPIWPLDPYD